MSDPVIWLTFCWLVLGPWIIWLDGLPKKQKKPEALIEAMTYEEVLRYSAQLDHEIWPTYTPAMFDHPYDCPQCECIRNHPGAGCWKNGFKCKATYIRPPNYPLRKTA